MSVTWTDLPIATASREKPSFRSSKNNSRLKTAILSSNLLSSMCGLRGAPSQMCGLEIERTSAGNISCLVSGRAGMRIRIRDFSIEDRSGYALRPLDGLTGSVHGSSLRNRHAYTLYCKVIMAAAEKI
jgi:hypothetical protein